MSGKRVVVVGAGIVGLCVAWHLANRGLKPIVLDGEEPGSGASSGTISSTGSRGPKVPPAVVTRRSTTRPATGAVMCFRCEASRAAPSCSSRSMSFELTSRNSVLASCR